MVYEPVGTVHDGSNKDEHKLSIVSKQSNGNSSDISDL